MKLEGGSEKINITWTSHRDKPHTLPLKGGGDWNGRGPPQERGNCGVLHLKSFHARKGRGGGGKLKEAVGNDPGEATHVPAPSAIARPMLPRLG